MRVLDENGGGTMSAVVSALDWVADQDVGPGNRKIVSMSAGGARSEAVDAAVRDLVRNLNVPVIVAAGNDGRDAEGTLSLIHI